MPSLKQIKKFLNLAPYGVLYTVCIAVSIFFTGTCYSVEDVSDPARSLETVTLQLKWKHQFQFAGYYAALEKGFYREAGLDVTILEAKDGQASTDQVIGGQADFGVAMSDLVLLRAKGHPVVALAAIYQHSPLILLAPKASGIENIHGLKGKRVAMEAHTAELLAYLEFEGVAIQDIQWFPHEYSVSNLLSGQMDAISAYATDEPFMLVERGIAYNTFSPRAGGIDFYGDTLFTNEKKLRENPACVSAFVGASLKGWQYALDHTQEIIDLILSKYTRRHSRPHLLFEAQKSKQLIMADVVELGYMNPGRWESISRTYATLGMIAPDFSLEGFLYQPDIQRDYTWLKWLLGAMTAVVLFGSIWSFVLMQFNKKMKIEIDERKRSEEKLRNIVENASNLFYSHTADHQLTYISPQCRDFLQCEPEEAMIRWTEFATDNPINPKGFELTQTAIRTGERQPPYELELVGMQGRKIFVEVRETPLVKDGQTISVVGSLTDITEQKQAQDALAESESRYRALFDFNPVQTIVVDSQAKIIMFNFARVKSSGRMPVIGDVMYRDYAAKHAIDMYKELMNCIQTDSLKSFPELSYKERILNVQISPFVGGAIITSEDITERIRLQRILGHTHKMEAVGTLSGGIAHEFNNILSIVLGNSELALDDIPKDNPTHDFLLEVRNASLRGKDVVRQLLDFSHKTDHKKESLNIVAVVRDARDLLRAAIPENIGFDERISQECDAVMGDRTQIHQLMIRLCNNAAQAMQDTGGALSIGLENISITRQIVSVDQILNPGDYVRLTVADTGMGIPAEVMDHVFDPFYTTKEMDQGAGMGLAVVYGIIKGHDGFIQIDSDPGQGTRISCYFPSKGVKP